MDRIANNTFVPPPAIDQLSFEDTEEVTEE
jgi:hypothetical protein